jgi:hypothetical protein
MATKLSSLVPNYCVSQFGENAGDPEVANLLDYAILAPYVEITFLKFGLTFYNNAWKQFSISVGNDSSILLDNTASIQSFTYSAGQAYSVTFEIFDTDGGNFDKVYSSIQSIRCENKGDTNKSGAAALNDVSWDWGWIGLDQNGVARPIFASSASKLIVPGCGDGINVENRKKYGTLNNINVSVDSKTGLFKYKINVMDAGQVEYQPVKVENVFGKEDAPMGLKDAMSKIMTGICGETAIKNPNVKFLLAKVKNDGSLDCESFKPKDGGDAGPKGVWPALGLSPHDAVTEWKNNFVSANGKGSIHGVIPTNPPTILLVTLPENVDPSQINKANQNSKVKTKELDPTKAYATYVVNGGNNSSVLSFEPKFYYAQSIGDVGSGGNSGGPVGPPQGVGQNPTASSTNVSEKTGPQVRIPVRYYDTYNTAPQNVLQQKADSYLKQAKTMGLMENLCSYEADLTIQGDPIRYCDFWGNCGWASIGIIFVNPFQLSKSPQNENEGLQPDVQWIAPDVCSKRLSRLMCLRSVTHNISGGKYTTTLNLLDAGLLTKEQKESRANQQPIKK